MNVTAAAGWHVNGCHVNTSSATNCSLLQYLSVVNTEILCSINVASSSVVSNTPLTNYCKYWLSTARGIANISAVLFWTDSHTHNVAHFSHDFLDSTCTTFQQWLTVHVANYHEFDVHCELWDVQGLQWTMIAEFSFTFADSKRVMWESNAKSINDTSHNYIQYWQWYCNTVVHYVLTTALLTVSTALQRWSLTCMPAMYTAVQNTWNNRTLFLYTAEYRTIFPCCLSHRNNPPQRVLQ